MLRLPQLHVGGPYSGITTDVIRRTVQEREEAGRRNAGRRNVIIRRVNFLPNILRTRYPYRQEDAQCCIKYGPWVSHMVAAAFHDYTGVFLVPGTYTNVARSVPLVLPRRRIEQICHFIQGLFADGNNSVVDQQRCVAIAKQIYVLLCETLKTTPDDLKDVRAARLPGFPVGKTRGELEEGAGADVPPIEKLAECARTLIRYIVMTRPARDPTMYFVEPYPRRLVNNVCRRLASSLRAHNADTHDRSRHVFSVHVCSEIALYIRRELALTCRLQTVMLPVDVRENENVPVGNVDAVL